MFGDAPWYGFLFLLLPVASVAIPTVLLYFAYRFLRAYERRSRSREVEEDLRARVAALEDQVARLSLEQDRLTDGQRFTNQLLAAGADARTSAPSSTAT